MQTAVSHTEFLGEPCIWDSWHKYRQRLAQVRNIFQLFPFLFPFPFQFCSHISVFSSSPIIIDHLLLCYAMAVTCNASTRRIYILCTRIHMNLCVYTSKPNRYVVVHTYYIPFFSFKKKVCRAIAVLGNSLNIVLANSILQVVTRLWHGCYNPLLQPCNLGYYNQAYCL